MHPPQRDAFSQVKGPGEAPGEALLQTERLMQRLARGQRIDRAGTMALEALATGGRRLRARLCLHAAATFGVAPRDAVAWAAAVELLHNATLVHDDVQDGDLTRRGEPTVWARHGVAQAINAGDYLLMLPFLALAELSEQRGELSFQLARAATRVVRGQAEELGLLWSERLDRASWLDAARGKTGALLGLPVLGAALLGGQSESAAEELGELFEELGVLFQLQDDVVDLFGDKGRGAVGCDVKEGKVSALVVLQLERRPESKDELLSILRLPREETTEAHIERVREMFLESGALSGVLELIQSIEARVKGAPALHREPSLSEVARKLLELTLSPIAHLFAPAEQLSEVRA